MLTKMIETLKKNPRTIVYTEGTDKRILESAHRLTQEGILGVVLLGKPEEVKAAAKAGNFNIDAKIGDTLVINGKEFVVTSNTLGNLKLVDSANIDLEETVITVAYGSQKKETVVGSNEVIKAEAFEDRPLSNVVKALDGASPGVLVGLRNSLSLAWMFMIAAELIAATQGIGYLLSDGRETSRPDIVIIAIILLAVLGKLTDTLMKWIENWFLRWRT